MCRRVPTGGCASSTAVPPTESDNPLGLTTARQCITRKEHDSARERRRNQGEPVAAQGLKA